MRILLFPIYLPNGEFMHFRKNISRMFTMKIVVGAIAAMGLLFASGGQGASAEQHDITGVLYLLLLDKNSSTGPHASLTYSDYPTSCLACHNNGSAGNQYDQLWNATHYQWLGTAEDMLNQSDTQQGKLTNSVNSYCINILGNWPVCGSCHAGRGIKPGNGDTKANIDCLVCHNKDYATQRTRLPDGSMGVAMPTDSMVRNIHAPTRTNCLMCHATAGGGDGVKRGDLSVATINNGDATFDVHMNTVGSDLSCQSCHVFNDHKVIGKGSDLRPTDDQERGSEVSCTTCHATMATSGHASTTTDRHVSRGKIACQVCHISIYAKVATETHRDWLYHHDGTDATTCSDASPCPGHPHAEKAADLTPKYKWWNRLSDNYLLGDDASITYDAALEIYPTSRPFGTFDLDDTDTKIYPFKYKTANQPMITDNNVLAALDTFVYMVGTGNVTEAVEAGLVNMGYSASQTVEWVTTDTYQLLNHGVEPAATALDCTDCHSGASGLTTNTRMPFAALGYHDFRNSSVNLCALCHELENDNRIDIHDRHVRSIGYACADCHGTGAPLRKPQGDLCNDCHGFESDTIQNIHLKHVKDKKYDCNECHFF